MQDAPEDAVTVVIRKALENFGRDRAQVLAEVGAMVAISSSSRRSCSSFFGKTAHSGRARFWMAPCQLTGLMLEAFHRLAVRQKPCIGGLISLAHTRTANGKIAKGRKIARRQAGGTPALQFALTRRASPRPWCSRSPCARPTALPAPKPRRESAAAAQGTSGLARREA